MCTAVTYKTRDCYFGRTLDYDRSFGEQIVVTPRNFPLAFRHIKTPSRSYAILGMASVAEGYPLYFDAVNERGLAIAGLNFVGNAVYQKPTHDYDNVAVFEFIPWILRQCSTVSEARAKIARIRLTDTAFSADLPPAELHWMIADRDACITVEATATGIQVYDNPVGVLTNNPPFLQQLFRLRDFAHLSPRERPNTFAPALDLRPYSRGMGGMGLPGDLSSPSRFVRAAFARMNAVSGDSEADSVGQFFHILDTVTQPRGCCAVEGGWEITRYASCCNLDHGIYYYTTYQNRQITAVDMHRENLDGDALVCYPLLRDERIHQQN